MFPPSDRCKPVVKALLAYPDAGTEANHLEIFRGVAQIVRSTVGDRQQLGDLLHPVNERGVSDSFAGLVRRFYGRGLVRSFVRNYHGISDRKFAWNCKFLTFHCRGFGRDFQVLTGQFSGIFADIRHRHVSFALLQTRCSSG